MWFVLLGPAVPSDGKNSIKAEKLLNRRKFAYPRRQTSLSEAYRHLAKITTLKDVPVRLYVSKDREMVSVSYFNTHMTISHYLYTIKTAFSCYLH